jgi:dipeptidyl aminopeptidase/acylaminoacyl peptidase
MKKLFFTFFAVLMSMGLWAQADYTEEFAVKDTNHLLLDVYMPSVAPPDTGFPCFVFVFGGGFISGRRDEPRSVDAFEKLSEKGFVVVAIDYRLGLKGVTKMGVNLVGTLEYAIRLAVEDLYSATSYLYNNAARFHINPNEIIISGGSAGAITALQADYWLHNQHETSKLLPSGFRYAGVISYAGAILSRNGKVKYADSQPAPTLFYHGTEDQLVTYNQVAFANIGFFGSNKIVPQFEKFGYPYKIRRMKNFGHEVAAILPYTLDEVVEFYQDWVKGGKKYQVDETWYNPDYKPIGWGRAKPSDLYNEKNK